MLASMEIAPEVIELEELAARERVDLPLALAKAGVAKTTHYRWTKGAEPLTGTIRKVRAAILELAQQAA